MVKILAFAGSARKTSFNKKLIHLAAQGAQQAGAEVTLIDLADYPMPIYNGDLETDQGIPENALKFKHLLIEHDGMLIASPEYNSAFSPLLKNVIDWASRAESKDEQPLVAYKGKVAALLAASPGPLGGLRGLVVLRMLLQNIGVIVLPGQKTIRQAHEAFNSDGSLKGMADNDSVKEIGQTLAEHLMKLHG